MPNLLAVDPGPSKSGWVFFENEKPTSWKSETENESLVNCFDRDWVIFGSGDGRNSRPIDHLVCEWVSSYGMAVGASVFDTCFWVGRFVQAIEYPYTLIARREVKRILGLKGKRVGDKEVREEMIKRWGKLPGMAGHAWAALAVGTAYLDITKENRG